MERKNCKFFKLLPNDVLEVPGRYWLMALVKLSSEIQVMNQSNSLSDSSGFLSTIKIKFIDHTTKKMLSTRRKIGCNMRLKSASLLLPVDVQSRGRENL